MAEERNVPFQFKLHKDVLEHACILSKEDNVGNYKVYMTKLVLKHVKRISKDRMHAQYPMPCKLTTTTKDVEIVTLMLTQSEFDSFRKLMKYHYYYNPHIDKYQNSRFMSCLIENAWLKRHPDETEVKKIETPEATKRQRVDLTGDEDFDEDEDK